MDRLVAAYASFPLLFWVLGSVLLYALGSHLRWLTRSQDFWRATAGNWLVQVGRFAFYLGLPYLALGGWPRQPFQGLLSLEDMGLVGFGPRWPATRWLEAVGTGLGLGLIWLLALRLAWINANPRGASSRLRFPPRSWWSFPIIVVCLQVHWAFYRGALTVALHDLYAGVFWGLGLVFLEWTLNPFWRRGWRLKGSAAGQWLHLALALLAALTFLLTHNLWVCIAVHTLLEAILWQLGQGRAAVEAL